MGVLDIAISGLKVAQESISTTGHNIANAGTPGYSRQEVVGNSANPLFRGFGFVGQGAEITTVRRLQDEFLTIQLRTDTSSYFNLETYRQNVQQIDRLLADDSTGLQSQLDRYFSALQGAADNPADIPSRTVALSEAESLGERFDTLNRYLQDLNDTLNGQIQSSVQQINAVTSGIAALNEAIVVAKGSPTQVPPNDLLDQRDELVRQLSEFVDIDVITVNDTYNIAMSNGQLLVSRYDASVLESRPSAANPFEYGVTYIGTKSAFDITDTINGGSLGGMFNYREQALAPAMNNLGRIAVGLIQETNVVHHLGIDLNGNFGGDFFKDLNDKSVVGNRVYTQSGNSPPNDNYFSVYFDDISQLTTSNYELSIPGPGSARFEITRISDGEVILAGGLEGSYPQTMEFDGLRLVLESGTFSQGDKFTIAPLREAAADVSVVIGSAEEMALAYPIRAQSSLGNLGSGEIDQGTMLSLDSAAFGKAGELSPPLVIIFTSPTSYSVLDNSNPGNPVSLSPAMENLPYVPGASNTIFTGDPGETIVSSWRAPLSLNPAIGINGPSDIALSNNINPERVQFLVTDSETGKETALPVISTAGGITAADLAMELDKVEGVTARAFTEVEISYFTNSGTTYTPDNEFEVWINGVELTQTITSNSQNTYEVGYPEQVPEELDPNFLADRINANFALQAMGVSARSDGDTLTIIDKDGDDILVEMRGDKPQPVITGAPPLYPNDPFYINGAIEPGDTFSVSTGETYSVTSLVGDTQGELNNLSGYNFDVDGPYVYQVDLPDDSVGSIELTGDYATADDVKNEIQRQLDVLVTDPGFTKVTFGPRGEIQYKVFAQMKGTGNLDVQRLNIGGKVDVVMADGIRMKTDPDVGGIFNGIPNAELSYKGFQFDISGYPEEGDEFTIEWNESGVSDNRNALDLVALQTKRIIAGNSNVGEAYGQLVVKIGVLTSQAQIRSDAAYEILQNTKEEISNVSGVNLDEEAARLIEFQAAYNANARVISIAQELFDALLAAF